MTTEQLGELFPIILEPSNPEWKSLFESEKQNLINILGKKNVTRVEHFGSTAIPGILAKPTIDILLEIPGKLQFNKDLIKNMKSNNYEYILRKDSKPDYMMFLKGYTMEGFKGQCYHIHMAPETHNGLWDRLYFRDFLINNKETAKEYESLKISLMKRYKNNREKYTDGKTNFIKKITTLAKNNNIPIEITENQDKT